MVRAMACFGCERVERIRRGADPDFLAELGESYVVLADEQAYRGYCLLVLKDHAEHLTELPLERQVRLWEDVSLVGSVLMRELAPTRLNYACLGNMMTHIHWHVTPRYAEDPEAQHPIWVRPLAERRLELPGDERAALMARLRRGLAA
jgi:diadenosine tetraphosphate (Ap4A) HIT family hydrolase